MTRGRSGSGGPGESTASTSPEGAEGATPAEGGECKITSSEAVAAAYGGPVTAEAAATSGIGNPICQFSLKRSNAGVPGRVSVTLNSSTSAATFAKIKRQAQGAVPVAGVGDSAFYLPSTATMQFIKGRTAVVIQADLRTPHGMPPKPSQVRADTGVLAKAIAATV